MSTPKRETLRRILERAAAEDDTGMIRLELTDDRWPAAQQDRNALAVLEEHTDTAREELRRLERLTERAHKAAYHVAGRRTP